MSRALTRPEAVARSRELFDLAVTSSVRVVERRPVTQLGREILQFDQYLARYMQDNRDQFGNVVDAGEFPQVEAAALEWAKKAAPRVAAALEARRVTGAWTRELWVDPVLRETPDYWTPAPAVNAFLASALEYGNYTLDKGDITSYLWALSEAWSAWLAWTEENPAFGRKLGVDDASQVIEEAIRVSFRDGDHSKFDQVLAVVGANSLPRAFWRDTLEPFLLITGLPHWFYDFAFARLRGFKVFFELLAAADRDDDLGRLVLAGHVTPDNLVEYYGQEPRPSRNLWAAMIRTFRLRYTDRDLPVPDDASFLDKQVYQITRGRAYPLSYWAALPGFPLKNLVDTYFAGEITSAATDEEIRAFLHDRITLLSEHEVVLRQGDANVRRPLRPDGDRFFLFDLQRVFGPVVLRESVSRAATTRLDIEVWRRDANEPLWTQTLIPHGELSLPVPIGDWMKVEYRKTKVKTEVTVIVAAGLQQAQSVCSTGARRESSDGPAAPRRQSARLAAARARGRATCRRQRRAA